MDISSITSMMRVGTTDNATNAATNAQADSLSKNLNNISVNSTEEELKGAIKDFESYFVEQLLKEVKDSLKSDDKDSTMSQYQDYFMDATIEQMADKLVNECGETLTQQLYEQMKRNYNIE